METILYSKKMTTENNNQSVTQASQAHVMSVLCKLTF